jgi:hypothetical protein
MEMSIELKEQNLRLLYKEVREAGFPDEIAAKLKDRVLNDQSYAFYIIQALEIEARRIFASLYFERPMNTVPYRFLSFNLSFNGETPAPIRENQFSRGKGYDVSLQEGINLMEGRYIFREPAFDPERAGYWVWLGGPSEWPGQRILDYSRNDFRAEAAIDQSDLWRWLIPAKRKELAEELKRGGRVELVIAPMGATRTVWAEVDPANRRLVLTNARGQHMSIPGTKQIPEPIRPVLQRSRGRSI